MFIQSGVRHFPKLKMAAAAILDFQVMWIWPFRRVDSVAFVFCTKFGSNICYSHWDRRTYVQDVHLMTSRELTSGFDFWSRRHLRVAVMHLHIKYMVHIYPVRSYWYFSKIQDGGRRHLGFLDYVNLTIGVCWQCGICALYQIELKYLHWSLRSTHLLCLRRSFDDITRINFRFRLLVTWSSAHGSDASVHKIWCRHLYPMRSYWHFAEIKDGGRRHLGFVGGAVGPPTKTHPVVRTPCKNFAMIGSVGFKL